MVKRVGHKLRGPSSLFAIDLKPHRPIPLLFFRTFEDPVDVFHLGEAFRQFWFLVIISEAGKCSVW